MLLFLHLCFIFLGYVYFVSSIKSYWNKAPQKIIMVMAKYSGTILGELHLKI